MTMLEELMDARRKLELAEQRTSRAREHRNDLIMELLRSGVYSERAVAVAAGITRPMLYKVKSSHRVSA